MRGLAWAGCLGCAMILLCQTPSTREQVGPLPGGSFLLNSGWRIQPAGKQGALDTFPMASALSKDGKFLLVLHGGVNPPSIAVLRTDTMEETSRMPLTDAWLGLAFSPDGKRVYVGGGSRASVFEYSWSDGKLAPSRTFTIVPEEKRTSNDFIGDVAVSPDGRMVYAAGLFHNAILVINLQSGRAIERFPTGRRPYRILFHPDGKSYFVSSWADGSVYHHNADNGQRLEAVRLGQHPTDMIWRGRKSEEKSEEQAPWAGRLFVAASNTNSVYVVGVSESKDLKPLATVNLAMTARQPAGMTPSALAMNSDESQLYAVCSDVNAVAVVDISEADSAVLGYVPTAWYPTAARSLPDGRLAVLNGRGPGSFPNPKGAAGGARVQPGSVSMIERIDDEALDRYTKTVLDNSPFREELLDQVNIPTANPVPSRPGDPSPIQHVVYIVKQGRAYDEVLGGLGKGNGDSALTVFPEKVAPNHHKLAREFVLFDNFYVNGDATPDGVNWSLAAIAPDYVQKLWPNSIAGRRKASDFEGGEPAALPPAGYLWTNAASAGLTLRNYGWWVTNTAKPASGQAQVERVRDSALAKFTNMNFRGFDKDYPDVERAKVFLADLQEFEKTDAMPKLTLLRLGNDHAAATMGDNDTALGMIVEALSKSKFWPQTAIFVVEADAGDGVDHVDSHRSLAYVISPYTRRDGFVDSSLYNTASMLRTMELILGLRPMTIFDAAAKPMWNAFSVKPDIRPYSAQAAAVAVSLPAR